jgi:hypothetical protein
MKITEKPARLAPIIEHDAGGQRIVGWIDKNTGKKVGETEDKQPAKKSDKASEK